MFTCAAVCEKKLLLITCRCIALKCVFQKLYYFILMKCGLMLASGILVSGLGMTPRVVKVQHKLVFSEIQGIQTCTLEVVPEASVGQKKTYSIYW